MGGIREIALDTETTGLNVQGGDRIIEIGCVEIIDNEITGNSYHSYINPEKELDLAAQEITGLTYEKLKQYPVFRDVVGGFLDFIGNDRLVIHNASFDVGFLNTEISGCGLDYRITYDRVVDTLLMARKKYPGSGASLDALCRRFNINSDSRVKHGALIDSELLAKVYVIMSVEVRQVNLFGGSAYESVPSVVEKYTYSNTTKIDRHLYDITQDELNLHKRFIHESIRDAIWNR